METAADASLLRPIGPKAKESRAEVARRSLRSSFVFRVFIFVSTACAFAEPVLVAFPFNDTAFTLQVIVLLVSTCLFFVGVVLSATHMEDELETLPFAVKILESFDGEVFTELLLLGIGWICIYQIPGLGVLRCLRVFRYLWYIEIFDIRRGSIFFGISHASRLCIVYLEKLYEELFTSRSKGAVVVLGIFFYMSYIFGIMFYTITQGMGNVVGCDTIVHCMWVMIRLSLYDQDGFNYVFSLFDTKYRALTVLLIIYMCITAMIFLNGLIGIFGDAFYVVVREVDPDEDDMPHPEGGRFRDSYNGGAVDTAAVRELTESSRNIEVMLLSLAQDNQLLRAELKSLKAEFDQLSKNSS